MSVVNIIRISIEEAQQRLPELVRAVEAGTPVMLMRDDKAVIALHLADFATGAGSRAAMLGTLREQRAGMPPSGDSAELIRHMRDEGL
jgi:antitoxin (DNA-binding transcriptional repressor) of toxin-antitoxin stability system